MTQDSLNNYIANVYYYTKSLASDVSDMLSYGDCKVDKYILDLNVVNGYTDLLKSYKLDYATGTYEFYGSGVVSGNVLVFHDDNIYSDMLVEGATLSSSDYGLSFTVDYVTYDSTNKQHYVVVDETIPSNKYNIPFTLDYVSTVTNCVSSDDMINVSVNVNRILNVNYNVDFVKGKVLKRNNYVS